jgi:hypothetical protein
VGEDHTSQYGQLRALLADNGFWLYEKFKRVLEDDILSGLFAKEWSDVQFLWIGATGTNAC